MVQEKAGNKKKLKPLKFKSDPRLLDRFGIAMYSKFNKAIGELIVNGYDADASWVKVNVKSGKITIADNGSGMDEKDIRNEYMMLGSEHKRSIRRTPKFGRLPIGNKGIGKLAGLGIANKMAISTVKDCKKYEYHIDRDEIRKFRTLEDALLDSFTVEDCGGKPSETMIELTKIFPHVKIGIKDLRGHLAREIPQDNNFQIFVNGEKCLRKDIPAKRKIPINIIDDICGEIVGEIIVAKKALITIKPGVFTTVRGRVVGPPSLFDVTKKATRYRQVFVQFVTGTIEVISFDPGNGQDEIPIIKTDREGFNEDHPKYKRYSKIMTEVLNKICTEEENEFEKKRELEKQSEVGKAIKNVTSDFNAYNKEQRQEVGSRTAKQAEENIPGDSRIFKEIEEPLVHPREPNKEKRTNPVGITDKRLKEELKRMIGHGTIYLGNKRYKVTQKPLGEDDKECRIDDEALVININTDHPAYDQAVAARAVEIVVFRAIAGAFAWKESETPEDLYEQLDDMIRFQAERMEKRRFGIKRTRKA